LVPPIDDDGDDYVGAPYSDPETSKQAAREILPYLARLEAAVFRVIERAGIKGACVHEIEDALAMLHQTAGARVRGLVLLGLVEDSGLRRPTHTGRQSKAWRVALKGTRAWDEHPEGWDFPCECATCISYADLEPQGDLFP